MTIRTQKDPAEIRALRDQNPKMRERDFARIHGVSEAELVAAYVGAGTIRLRPDVATLLAGLPAVGEVMALTRNESVVHEKIGPYENAKAGQNSAIVLGEQIDLRIFPSRWASGFAVSRSDEEGNIKRSLQFFDAAGDAVHKVHLRPASDLGAFTALVEALRAEDQSQVVEISEVSDPDAVDPGKPAAEAAELYENWRQLTDTHQFFGMLKRLNLTRHQALTRIGQDYAWPLDPGAATTLLERAAGTDLPIMVFVGNPGCIQIHGGPISKVSAMGPWINVLDETFHMHLRTDQIAEVWAVRKPTSDGHVTSIEVFDAARRLIVQFFGKRQEGTDERAGWRALAEGLPRLAQTTAA